MIGAISEFTDFNPRPPRGGRRANRRTCVFFSYFNPRPPRGGRPRIVPQIIAIPINFNPRPPRGGRRAAFSTRYACQSISIHVPREGDDEQSVVIYNHRNISIHVPREGDDHTSPKIHFRWKHFNPRPPRGGRPASLSTSGFATNFNPRPPRGGRPVQEATLTEKVKFQSTSPARGTTGSSPQQQPEVEISIHVPREGDDLLILCRIHQNPNFNPRPPRGGRQQNCTAQEYIICESCTVLR